MRKFGFAITSHGTVWHKLSMHHRIKKKNNSFLDIFYHTRGLGVLILVLVLSVSMIGIVKAECVPVTIVVVDVMLVEIRNTCCSWLYN